jgi:hypothetical protein
MSPNIIQLYIVKKKLSLINYEITHIYISSIINNIKCDQYIYKRSPREKWKMLYNFWKYFDDKKRNEVLLLILVESMDSFFFSFSVFQTIRVLFHFFFD